MPTIGRFITFEGGEGAGKTTQLRRLAEALESPNRAVVRTREPGGSPGAEEIRALLVQGEIGRWHGMTEALMHFAARHDHLKRCIEPALMQGKWVLSDRFADSTMAYQGYGLGLGIDAIETLYRLAIGNLKPDLTLILDLPVEVGLSRAEARRAASEGAEDRYERMARPFHERLREAFLDIAAHEPERCAVIDAQASEDAVQAAIRKAVRDRLGVHLPLDG